MGLGCWAIGGPTWRGETPVGWGEVDDEDSIKAIQRALELGVTLFDTADAYGAGHSERVLGHALGDKRSQVVIATKFGNRYHEDTKQLNGPGTDAEYIQTACARSLKRLNTDYIDLYQFHLGDFEMDKAAEVRDTLEGLVQAGKIRAYGWSTDDPERAKLFAQGEHCATVQFQENVLDDNPAMIELCNSLNLGGLNRGPLAMGLLTGKYDADSTLGPDDVRGTRSPDWMKYFKNGQPNPEWREKVTAIREVLTSEGRSLAQGALAWLWARSPHLLPIPGFRTVEQVKENAKAMQFGPLSQDQMQQIRQVLERG